MRLFQISSAIPEAIGSNKFLDTLDFCCDKQGGLAGREWCGNFNLCADCILFSAVKTKAAFRNIFAFNDVI